MTLSLSHTIVYNNATTLHAMMTSNAKTFDAAACETVVGSSFFVVDVSGAPVLFVSSAFVVVTAAVSPGVVTVVTATVGVVFVIC